MLGDPLSQLIGPGLPISYPGQFYRCRYGAGAMDQAAMDAMPLISQPYGLANVLADEDVKDDWIGAMNRAAAQNTHVPILRSDHTDIEAAMRRRRNRFWRMWDRFYDRAVRWWYMLPPHWSEGWES